MIMSCVNKDNFMSSFSICMPSFSCLIVFVRTSSVMVRGDIVALVPNLEESFSPLSMMTTIYFLLIFFIKLRKLLSNPRLLRVLLINGCWILSNAISVFIDIVI